MNPLDTQHLRQLFARAIDALMGDLAAAGSIRNVWTYVLDHWKELRQLPAVAEFARTFTDASLSAPGRPGISHLTLDETGVRSWVDESVEMTLAHLASTTGAEPPSNVWVEQYWLGLCQWFFDPHVDLVEIAYIANFDSEREDIEFADGLRFHQLSSVEKVRLRKEMLYLYGNDPFNADWRATWNHRVTRADYRARRLPSRIPDLRLALQLLKPGAVWVLFRGRKTKYPIIGDSGILAPSEDRRPAGGRYRLLASEIEELMRLTNAITRSNFVALESAERFQKSYHREEPLERLVDLVIALEGLFVPEGEEVASRLARRGSRMLASTDAERHTLFVLLRNVYGVRNTAVHCGDVHEDDRLRRAIAACGSDVLDVANKLEELARRALRERLLHRERFRQDALDR